MSENRKLSLSRRDFMRLSALAAGGAALASGLPRFAFAQDIEELTVISPGRDLDVQRDQVIVDRFNADAQAAGLPYRMKLITGPATDNDFVTKINLDFAAGQAADVTGISAEQYQDSIAAGYLADLTDLVNGWDQWDKYAPVIKDLLSVDDRVYGLSRGSAFTMYYRKDVLEGAGISTAQPQTWDEFFTLCDSILTKTGATPTGLPAARPWGGGTWGEGFRHVWMGFAESNQIYDQADNKWVVKSDGLLKAFQVYETLAKNKWLTVDALVSPNPWEPIKYQGFVNGTVAVVTGGDWQWQFDWGPNGQGPIEGLFEKVDRWLFPSAVSKPFPYSALGGLAVVASTSKDIPAAFEFLKALNYGPGSCAALEVVFDSPSAISDYGDTCPYYNTGVNGKMAQAGEFLATGRYLKTGPGEAKIVDGIGLATENIITGIQTSEQAMDEFAASMRDAIGEDGVKEL